MAEAKKKTETIRLFSDGGKYKGDLFVSVNGVNYQLQRGKNIEVPPEVAEVIPLERIVVETDAPSLTPEPFRGKRNDSRYLPYVIEKMARWKGVTPEELTEITFANGKRLFGLE